MAPCTDPRLTYLNDSGYNVVRLPRKGIIPLGVIGRDDKSKLWLGTIDQVWTSTEPVPTPGAPQAVASLQGQRTNDLKASLGLEVLGDILNGMFGGMAPSISPAYHDAKFVSFAFKDVRVTSVDPFVIGGFLGEGKLRPNPVVEHYLSGNKDVEAFVVCEVLEARSIGVTAKRDASTSVALDVPQIHAMLGAKVAVTATTASQNEIVFEGPEYLAFGYKALGIRRDGEQWQVYGMAAGGGMAFGASPTTDDGTVHRNELVEIDFSTASA